ncbi:Cytochrome P450 [Trinorchestia longiramus]|nr:Cytochrome P450 [Trinorchestia longiramus]
MLRKATSTHIFPVHGVSQSLHLSVSARLLLPRCLSTCLSLCSQSSAGLGADSAVKSKTLGSNVLPFTAIPGPKRFPLVGSLLSYKLGLKKEDYYHEYLQQLYENYGPVVREDLGPLTVIHIFDPKDINDFYKTNLVPYILPLLETAKEFKVKKGAGQGIGDKNGPEWQMMRKAINKLTLKPQFVYRYIPIHDEVALEAVSLLREHLVQEDGSVSHLEDLIDKFVGESIHRIVLGEGQGSLDPQRQGKDNFVAVMSRTNRRIFELSAKLRLSTGMYKKFSTPKSKELWSLIDFFYGSLHDMCTVAAFAKGAAVLASEGQQQQDKPEDDSMMLHMMRDNIVSAEDYVTIISSILTDAYVTTAPSLLGALHLLAVSPEVQEELREEAWRVCPSSGGPLTHLHLADAHKLSAFLKEALRLYPIGDSVQRLVKEDMVIKNYHLPAGTRLDLNLYPWLRDPTIFPDPLRVMLERWSRPPRGGVTDAFHPIINTPFSTGVRTCVGRRLATHDMTCFLLRLLQKFRLSQSPPTPPRQVYRILLRPQQPLHLKFYPCA